MSGVPAPVTPSERAAMVARVVDGKTRHAVAIAFRRSVATVYRHTNGVKRGGPSCQQCQVQHGLAVRAARTERLFAACNRAAGLPTPWEARA